MANLFGVEIPFPDLQLAGVLSSSWIYILIISFIGFLLIVGVCILLFFKTYSRKVIVFENISGRGYQPIIKTRARVIKLGHSGEEVLKTMAGGRYVSAYGRKMGKGTFWYAIGQDGYWYNILLGDLDAKLSILDIEPVDRDVRMFHVALSRLSKETYGKQKFMEKYGTLMSGIVILIVMTVAVVVIVGKIGDATTALANTAETNREVVDRLYDLRNVRSELMPEPTDLPVGLVPAGSEDG